MTRYNNCKNVQTWAARHIILNENYYYNLMLDTCSFQAFKEILKDTNDSENIFFDPKVDCDEINELW